MIHRALYKKDMIEYLVEKYKWNDEVVRDIDWNSMEFLINKQQGLYRTTLYRLIHYWQPTNSYVQCNHRKKTCKALCTKCENQTSNYITWNVKAHTLQKQGLLHGKDSTTI